MDQQSNLFSIDPAVTYLNCAYMSPLLKSSELRGIEGVKQKSKPYLLEADDFFKPAQDLRESFSTLIDCRELDRIVLIPSSSYGMANVVQNLPVRPNGNIVLVEHQFPSNVYIWQRWAAENHIEIRYARPGSSLFSKTESWNYSIHKLIDEHTIAVSMSHVHWADGTVFELASIRAKTHKYHAALIIDGTQSIGALPFSIQDIKPDALICAGYKYLLGPYSFGLAYYGELFDHGTPIEENWINRKNSHIFEKLVDYQVQYNPLASRYNVGEYPNFIAIPMLQDAIQQILRWGVENIQNYCARIIEEPIEALLELGCTVASSQERVAHLFGIAIPSHINRQQLGLRLKEEQVFLSFRGDSIRISPHVYNSQQDLDKLVHLLSQSSK